jgi:hypothetical protein
VEIHCEFVVLMQGGGERKQGNWRRGGEGWSWHARRIMVGRI